MARRRQRESSTIDDVYEFLSGAPVWAGPVLAALFYALSRWFVPWLLAFVMSGNKFGEGIAQPISMFAERFAPLLAAGVLLIWVMAEIKKRIDRNRFERVSGSASIETLGWREFESLLSEAFRRQGFVVEHTGKDGSDGGVDQRLSKAGAITLVQCKHWKGRQVGVKIVRELLGVITSEGAQSGIVVTSGQFTAEAVEFAAKNPIRLIDGRELVQMISEVQNSGRIKSAAGERPGAAESGADQVDPMCPMCGAAMVRRTAKRGTHAGSEFYGCSLYPECKGTRSLTLRD